MGTSLFVLHPSLVSEACSSSSESLHPSIGLFFPTLHLFLAWDAPQLIASPTGGPIRVKVAVKTTEHLIKMHSDRCFSIKPEALFITVFIIMGFNGKIPAVVHSVGLLTHFLFYLIVLWGEIVYYRGVLWVLRRPNQKNIIKPVIKLLTGFRWNFSGPVLLHVHCWKCRRLIYSVLDIFWKRVNAKWRQNQNRPWAGSLTVCRMTSAFFGNLIRLCEPPTSHLFHTRRMSQLSSLYYRRRPGS